MVEREQWTSGESLDITTTKVCAVNCAPVCPQVAFQQVYGDSDRLLSLENFKTAVAKVPTSVRINFSGFSEPTYHPQFLEMMRFVAERGHPFNLFTTLAGARPEWVPEIRRLNPDNIILHLPDNEGIAHLPPSDRYLKTVHLFLTTPGLRISKVMRMSRDTGFVSNERAGNCDNARPRHVLGPFHCPSLTFPQFIMLPNCDVTLCCMDWRLEHKMGNLLTQTWSELVNSPERKRLITNSHRLDGDTLCRRCKSPLSLASLVPKRENAQKVAWLLEDVAQRNFRRIPPRNILPMVPPP